MYTNSTSRNVALACRRYFAQQNHCK